jgi:hypothetical protein
VQLDPRFYVVLPSFNLTPRSFVLFKGFAVDQMAPHKLIDDAFSENVELAMKIHDAIRKVAYMPGGVAADCCNQETTPPTALFTSRSPNMLSPCKVRKQSAASKVVKLQSRQQKGGSWEMASHQPWIANRCWITRPRSCLRREICPSRYPCVRSYTSKWRKPSPPHQEASYQSTMFVRAVRGLDNWNTRWTYNH